MIKAQDLRIGNVVKSGKGLYRIYALSFPMILAIQSIEFDIDSEKGIFSFDSTIISPIPLTEEILLKCGYKFYNGKTEGDLCMDFGGKLDIDFINGKIQVKSHYEEYSMYRPIFEIKYLHQLQNLYFALAGQELNTAGL